MISAYNFSLTGRDHTARGMPCHDYSLIKEISSSWKLAIVADGVGSCSHAEIASQIASETAAELIERQFPSYGAADSEYVSVIIAAMHGAANAIEEYVSKNDENNEDEYQTTLALALMSKSKLFFGNAGDSGIIGLDNNGAYHVLSHAQNDEFGRVFAMPSTRHFEVGAADFTPAATICLTDGILLSFAPDVLKGAKFEVDVPFANLFCTYALGIDQAEEVAAVQKCKKQLIEYLSSDVCADMTDDLSAAVLVITDSELLPEDIEWEKPEIDADELKWREVSVYPSEKTRIDLFTEYLREKYPTMTAEQHNEIVRKYMKPNEPQGPDTIVCSGSEEPGCQEKTHSGENSEVPSHVRGKPAVVGEARKKTLFGWGPRQKGQ